LSAAAAAARNSTLPANILTESIQLELEAARRAACGRAIAITNVSIAVG
jgi:hypothetical protein